MAQVTNNMNAELIRKVGQNLTAFNVDVRIDYERWMGFEKEYGEWADARDSDSSTDRLVRK